MEKRNIADEPEMPEIKRIMDSMTEGEQQRTLDYVEGRTRDSRPGLDTLYKKAIERKKRNRRARFSPGDRAKKE